MVDSLTESGGSQSSGTRRISGRRGVVVESSLVLMPVSRGVCERSPVFSTGKSRVCGFPSPGPDRDLGVRGYNSTHLFLQRDRTKGRREGVVEVLDVIL